MKAVQDLRGALVADALRQLKVGADGLLAGRLSALFDVRLRASGAH